MSLQDPARFVELFRQRPLAGLMMAVVAALVYLATLSVMGEAALSSSLGAFGREAAGRLTVQVPPPVDREAGETAERVRKVMAAVMEMPEVGLATLVTEAETERLLAPWVADADLLRSLPLPTLIDIRPKPGAKLRAEALQEKLGPLVPALRVDGVGEWAQAARRAVRALRLAAWSMIAVTFLVLTGVSALVCRTALIGQRGTIELLHLFGATDRLIARGIGSAFFRLALRAVSAGALAAGLSVYGLAFFFRRLDAFPGLFTPDLRLLAALFFLTPLVALAISGLSARFFTLRFLRRGEI
jgi:cell division transport system permease protein